MYLFDLLDLGLSNELRFETVTLGALDRVACGAHASNLIAVAVGDPRVRHGVAVVAVRVELDHDGAVVDRVVLEEPISLRNRVRARVGLEIEIRI